MIGLLAGRRMLIVEDEMLVLMHIEAALAELGCSTVLAAANVDQAVGLLSKHNFDLAILDVNLGGEKSYPVADALAKRSIPFAFSTGCGDHGDRTDFEERPVLRKPYVQARLKAVVTQLLTGT
ncbi:response regulator [Sphingomonas sp. M1-B02]|uniref:response regulator n=1 Tax=Sphingomonas sp. M1-B02 TaxID=3114300 RepID=UPI00223EB360|nr:response regulator [Sphingomonas sp. S6-11]UZK67802.1 response regulator [Sphingomonas sp. S6-11]